MSTKASKVDEFESLFRSSVRPTVEIEKLPLNRILVVLDSEGTEEKRDAVVRIATDMVDRFRVDAHILAPVRQLQREEKVDTSRVNSLLAEALKAIEQTGTRQSVSGEVQIGPVVRTILDEVARYQPNILILNSLFGENDEDLEGYSLGSVADRVLGALGTPILLVEGLVQEVERMWSDILVYLEDQETAGPCFSATRSLAVKGAKVELLHVLEHRWMEYLHRALELTSKVATEEAHDAIRSAIHSDMQNYIEAAKDALDRTGHNTSFEMLEGDPVEVTRERVLTHEYGLLICNSVAPDQRLIESVAYNLAAYLRKVPLLLV